MDKHIEPKYCPIILMNRGYHREEELICVKNACAWWDAGGGACCVRSLIPAKQAQKPDKKAKTK